MFRDTPLIYVVKHGHLETLERLVQLPNCVVEQCDRNQRTALDHAIGAWLADSGQCRESRHYISRRYRIVNRLLASGAATVNMYYMSKLMCTALNSREGETRLDKLIYLICRAGSSRLKTAILFSLVCLKNTDAMLGKLSLSGANLFDFPFAGTIGHFIPHTRAIMLVRSTNHPRLLASIERTASDTYLSALSTVDRNEPSEYWHLLNLLTLCGHVMQLRVLLYLRQHRSTMYTALRRYYTQPKTLTDLSRMAVRERCRPNVIAAVRNLHHIPHSIMDLLLLYR